MLANELKLSSLCLGDLKIFRTFSSFSEEKKEVLRSGTSSMSSSRKSDRSFMGVWSFFMLKLSSNELLMEESFGTDSLVDGVSPWESHTDLYRSGDPGRIHNSDSVLKTSKFPLDNPRLFFKGVKSTEHCFRFDI